MQSHSLILHERPAVLEFTDKESVKCIVGTYQVRDNNAHSGSIYKIQGNRVDKSVALPGGIFRFAMGPNEHIISALTTGSIGVVDRDLDSVHILSVIKKGTLLSIAICGNLALCSDIYGTIHVINLETGIFWIKPKF